MRINVTGLFNGCNSSHINIFLLNYIISFFDIFLLSLSHVILSIFFTMLYHFLMQEFTCNISQHCIGCYAKGKEQQLRETSYATTKMVNTFCSGRNNFLCWLFHQEALCDGIKDSKENTECTADDTVYLSSCLGNKQKKMVFYAVSSKTIAWPTSGPHRLECVKIVNESTHNSACAHIQTKILFNKWYSLSLFYWQLAKK